MDKLFDCVAEKFALLCLQGDSSITKSGKDFVYMLDVLVGRFREDDYVVYVNKAGFPFEARQDDVHSALNSGWGFTVTESHSSLLELTGVAYDGSFAAVFFWHVDLPVHVELIGRCEDVGIPKGFDTIVHLGREYESLTVIVLRFR